MYIYIYIYIYIYTQAALCAGTHQHRAHTSDNELCSIDPPTTNTQPRSLPPPVPHPLSEVSIKRPGSFIYPP